MSGRGHGLASLRTNFVWAVTVPVRNNRFFWSNGEIDIHMATEVTCESLNVF